MRKLLEEYKGIKLYEDTEYLFGSKFVGYIVIDLDSVLSSFTSKADAYMLYEQLVESIRILD